MTAIVGRDGELRTGEAFLDDLAAGPALLLIEGEAGIGKTTLWSSIAERAEIRGLTVLRAQPTPAETSLSLATLGDLLASVPDRALERLPAVQRRAIEVALFRAEPAGRGVDQGPLGAGTRSVLLALATAQPVVVAIDDVQWLDTPSAVVLGYALRRIEGARVGVLVTRRSGEVGPVRLESLPPTVVRHHVEVGPLSLAATHHLLKDRLRFAPSRSLLVRIHRASGGHPLFALEIARLLHDRPEPPADEALPVPATIRERARLALANVVYDLDPSPRCARLALEALADADRDVELMTQAHATLAAVDYEDWRRAGRHARAAKRLLAEVSEPSPTLESFVLYGYAAAEIRDGNPLPMDVIDRALELERIAPAPVVSDRLSASLGYWLFLTADDLDGGRQWMEATYAAAVEEGDEGSIPYALSHRPLLEFAAGDWATAEVFARRYLSAAVDAGQDSARLDALFALGLVLIHQGREAAARPLIEELLRDAEDAGSLWDLTKGLAALGALELALGDSRGAARHLLQADEGRDRLGDEQNRRHEGDLVEALIAAGRIEHARGCVASIEGRARRYRRHSRLAVAARCRALLCAAEGDLDAASAALDEALREHDLAPFPFERARTELVLGRVRRRRRERTLAKAAFESALAGFERLGSTLWSQHARAELDRVGLRRGSGDALTETERRVAELVAAGRTVPEAAAALFVSPRTVESNLSRAYRKLGIASRAELGAVMAEMQERSSPDRGSEASRI